ncbi:pyridoxal phosphate-dependent aminotransferase [Christensenellaceae bacterium NSJ-63]|uniref:Aminotransferase n=1 Tax=Guopingia tenuis TaxID=2763656 RepID=A0A926DLJ6_9FIRM|nr:pyridoxal phosphate-dependent aminotransferase [Guopingia tenuis]MBC8539325.1 pyridoxal phosphate-dependent aminotransferase [Guopingia tenuis]MBS5645129.1 pyridoxal phosphate-dependent aminotransferase [Clostridiales bacterium]
MQISKKALGISPSLTLGIDALSKEMKQAGKDVVGFGAGEPDFDTPAYIKEAAVAAIGEGKTKYTPASGILELKQAVCDRYKNKFGLEYAPAQVVVSSGAKHSLFNTFAAILNPGDEVIIITPYWLTYPELVKMADGVPVFVEAREEDGFAPCSADIEAAVTKKTRAIIVNSPSNPCGCVYSEKCLREIARLAEKHDLYIVADEIYDELIYTGKAMSIAMMSDDAKARTIIVNGMSKAYAMTGWRIGYTIAPAEVAKVMGSYQSHSTSNPCSIAQYASVAALTGPQEDKARMVEVFASRSRLMAGLINAVPGMSCREPEGAFYIFASIRGLIGKKYRGEVITGSVKFAELLLENELTAVVPGIAFGADDYIRLSYATSEENIKKGLARIEKFCREVED